jgi:PAS domain S-box-containing protein
MIAPFDREAVLEETIADLEALYDYHAMILSQARVGVLDWPVNDARVYMSPCLKSMLGYDDNELPDAFTEWLKHIHNEDRDTVIEEMREAVREGRPTYHRVHRVTRRDGTSGWILFRAQITPKTEERAGRLLGAVIDITDIQQMIGESAEATAN